MPQRTSRAWALRASCPECGAQPGDPCTTIREGWTRRAFHGARHDQARREGAPNARWAKDEPAPEFASGRPEGRDAHRVAEVAALRAKGHTLPEIAAKLGLSRSYVGDLAADPTGSKKAQRQRRYDARRRKPADPRLFDS